MEEPNIDIVTEDSEMNDPINTDDENTEESLNESEDYEDNLDSSLSFAQDIDLIEDDDISYDMDDSAVDDSEDSDTEPDANDDADNTGDNLDDDSSEDDNADESDDESSNAADEPSDNTGDDAGANSDGDSGAETGDLDDGDGDNADDGDDNDDEDETPPESDVTHRAVELNVGAVSAYGIALKNGFVGTELEWLRMFNDKISPNEKGVAGGVATLDMNGLIPTNQIPGAYDDVIDGFYDSDTDKFYKDVEKTIEVLGESGKIYVDITGAPIQYRYGGATFVRITTNEVTSMTDEDIYEILSM